MYFPGLVLALGAVGVKLVEIWNEKCNCDELGYGEVFLGSRSMFEVRKRPFSKIRVPDLRLSRAEAERHLTCQSLEDKRL